ncbi:dienelactone hydrolase family protein [Amnibacterium flavum]|uniref:dienelactone hydrolase family protein n=1 Tax=Amnibacterium flavum TaxID=2173173 RepID=UPI00196A6B93|nr:dienelactone hydrolase family protein [Amnibacterium flavum]
MSSVAIFHSVLGVRQGVTDLASLFESNGHRVVVVDQYEGRIFDDYETASGYVDEVGFPALMRVALDAVADLDDGFFVAGFSNGAGMAQHVALNRRTAGALLLSGAMPIQYLGAETWPQATPVQIHFTLGDPFHDDDGPEQFAQQVLASRASLEFYEYPGSGHLFTDPSLPGEYDARGAALVAARSLRFVDDSD